jgi:ADP-heptose:LPS heptosyltransferase
MIINIEPGTFGTVRNGDMIAVANILEHIRKTNNNPLIQFHLKPGNVNEDTHCQTFYEIMLKMTNYFSTEPGEQSLPWRKVNVWDFRDISGDLVKIKNDAPMEKKIAVFPLFDAPYNVWRNWPQSVYEQIIKKFSTEEYKDYEKIICIKGHFGEKCPTEGWRYSTNFVQNYYHITTAEIFVGGDTGSSHFAWALDRGPKELLYYGSSRGLIHTLPFYLLEGKGKMTTYWLDFEGTQF